MGAECVLGNDVSTAVQPGKPPRAAVRARGPRRGDRSEEECTGFAETGENGELHGALEEGAAAYETLAAVTRGHIGGAFKPRLEYASETYYYEHQLPHVIEDVHSSRRRLWRRGEPRQHGVRGIRRRRRRGDRRRGARPSDPGNESAPIQELPGEYGPGAQSSGSGVRRRRDQGTPEPEDDRENDVRWLFGNSTEDADGVLEALEVLDGERSEVQEDDV